MKILKNLMVTSLLLGITLSNVSYSYASKDINSEIVDILYETDKSYESFINKGKTPIEKRGNEYFIKIIHNGEEKEIQIDEFGNIYGNRAMVEDSDNDMRFNDEIVALKAKFASTSYLLDDEKKDLYQADIEALSSLDVNTENILKILDKHIQLNNDLIILFKNNKDVSQAYSNNNKILNEYKDAYKTNYKFSDTSQRKAVHNATINDNKYSFDKNWYLIENSYEKDGLPYKLDENGNPTDIKVATIYEILEKEEANEAIIDDNKYTKNSEGVFVLTKLIKEDLAHKVNIGDTNLDLDKNWIIIKEHNAYYDIDGNLVSQDKTDSVSLEDYVKENKITNLKIDEIEYIVNEDGKIVKNLNNNTTNKNLDTSKENKENKIDNKKTAENNKKESKKVEKKEEKNTSKQKDNPKKSPKTGISTILPILLIFGLAALLFFLTRKNDLENK